MKIIDLRNKKVFPSLRYRFSKVTNSENSLTLERDFIGENPLHYYVDSSSREIIIANTIREIKKYLENNGGKFFWEYVRAVSNNKKVIVTPESFYNSRAIITELQLPLQEMKVPDIDFHNMKNVGVSISKLLTESIRERIKSIEDDTIGILLSGGLDSITTLYFLKNNLGGKKIRAFTLKVNENESDVVKARDVAKKLHIPLTEVKIGRRDNMTSVDVEVYDKSRNLERSYNLIKLNTSEVISETLKIAENPKKDNLFCSLAMYLIGMAVKNENIKTVFCGEGPNEMINDYGFEPAKNGYSGMEISDTYFRQALTFGVKEADMQLGRGGLAKHALSRMGKMFAYYDIRLESPFFNSDIANVLTRVPYLSKNYNTIKQKIDSEILGLDSVGILGRLDGISKEKFQDGSGISKIFAEYDQKKLTLLFNEIYGVNKTVY